MIKWLNLWPHLHVLPTNPPLLDLFWSSTSQGSFAHLQHNNTLKTNRPKYTHLGKTTTKTTTAKKTACKETFSSFFQVQKMLNQNYAGLISRMGSMLKLCLVSGNPWRKVKVMLQTREETLFLFQCIFFSLLGSELATKCIEYLCMYSLTHLCMYS